jgi:hypothetical protein
VFDVLLQVHGDVFRPPVNASLLSTYVGIGVQLFGMTMITMIFALLGFLSPANRGGLMTAMLMMFVFMGLFAGYFSARLYKTFKGEEWKKTTFRTAMLFPGVQCARMPATLRHAVATCYCCRSGRTHWHVAGVADSRP